MNYMDYCQNKLLESIEIFIHYTNVKEQKIPPRISRLNLSRIVFAPVKLGSHYGD